MKIYTIKLIEVGVILKWSSFPRFLLPLFPSLIQRTEIGNLMVYDAFDYVRLHNRSDFGGLMKVTDQLNLVNPKGDDSSESAKLITL